MHEVRTGDCVIHRADHHEHTRDSNDMCWYPRSSGISWRGLGVLGRIEALEYGDGEPDD